MCACVCMRVSVDLTDYIQLTLLDEQDKTTTHNHTTHTAHHTILNVRTLYSKHQTEALLLITVCYSERAGTISADSQLVLNRVVTVETAS